MAKMMNPELEIVRFENEDVIATSHYYTQNGKMYHVDGNGNVTEATNTSTKFDYNGKVGSSAADAANNNPENTQFYYNPVTGNYSANPYQ